MKHLFIIMLFISANANAQDTTKKFMHMDSFVNRKDFTAVYGCDNCEVQSSQTKAGVTKVSIFYAFRDTAKTNIDTALNKRK